MKFLGFVFALLLLASSLAFAANKPQMYYPDDLYSNRGVVYSLSGESSAIEGQACSVEYATSGAYCSDRLKVYYQCIHTTVNDMSWQKRSEDCSKYNAFCIANDCRGGQLGDDLALYGVIFAAGVIVVLHFVYRKLKIKKRK